MSDSLKFIDGPNGGVLVVNDKRVVSVDLRSLQVSFADRNGIVENQRPRDTAKLTESSVGELMNWLVESEEHAIVFENRHCSPTPLGYRVMMGSRLATTAGEYTYYLAHYPIRSCDDVFASELICNCLADFMIIKKRITDMIYLA